MGAFLGAFVGYYEYNLGVAFQIFLTTPFVWFSFQFKEQDEK